MICATVFELLGALTVGARTADTIKNGIIPPDSFQGNAGVQMLAFTCACECSNRSTEKGEGIVDVDSDSSSLLSLLVVLQWLVLLPGSCGVLVIPHTSQVPTV